MHIGLVHTPMPRLDVEGRRIFWRNFDLRYYAVHPNLRPMKKNLWEIPHWMTWLGGVLYHEGFDSMEVLEFYTEYAVLNGIDEHKIFKALTTSQADVYLFSPMTPNLPHALRIADLIKALYPESITIFGGVVATPLHREVVSHPSVDYVVFDRGEYALPLLLKTIIEKGDITKVGNLTYKNSDGQPITNQITYPYMPVEQIPFPKIDLFPRSVGENIRYIRQVFSLGCPYDCAFCTIQTIGRKPSYFPIERVLAEISAYKEHFGEHHYIYFGDETFTLNTKRTLEFCAALESQGNIFYDCQTRLNCLQDTRLHRALYQSGCRWLEIGLETANQESLNLFKEGTRIAETENTLAVLRDAGLPTCAFMVNGFPNQTVGDMQRSIDWVCSLIDRGLLHASYLFGLVPYPGSAMFRHPERVGMKIHHHDYALYNEDLIPVFDSTHATAEQIYEVFLKGITSIGKAMEATPYLGEIPRSLDLDSLGSFWQETHV